MNLEPLQTIAAEEKKTPLWLYFSGAFLLALFVGLSILVYSLFFRREVQPQPKPSLPGIWEEVEEQESERTPTEAVETDLNQLEEELEILDQIDEELNSPDVDFNLDL